MSALPIGKLQSETILPLALFALISTSTPGIATTLSTASSAQFGFRRSVPLMAGSAAGLASVAAAGAAGLAGLLAAVPSLQLAMKIVGLLYLIWLAIKIGRSGPPHLDVTMARPNSFFGGAGIQWLIPKGRAMGLGAAASFAALADGPLQLALLLGAVFGLAAAFSLSLWCVAGTLLARLLRTERQWRVAQHRAWPVAGRLHPPDVAARLSDCDCSFEMKKRPLPINL